MVLATCIFCGNEKWNLELSAEKGLYHCWACRAGGRLDGILSQLTGKNYRLEVHKREKPKQAAPPPDAVDFSTTSIGDVPSALHYLMRRGITLDVAAAYGLRFCTQIGHLLQNRIVIPAYDFWTGATLGWIGRNYTNGRPKYISTIGRKMIFGWRQRSRTAAVVIVEGGFDGIAVHRAGFHAAVLGGTGGAGVQELCARLDPALSVVIMLDGDAVQQATQLYWQATQVREKVALAPLLPGVDPGSLSPDQIQEVVSRVR